MNNKYDTNFHPELPPNSKVLTEAETRKRLLNTASQLGCYGDVKQIMDKTDRLLANCTNQEERKQIAMYGALELHMLLGGTGDLEVGGKKVFTYNK